MSVNRKNPTEWPKYHTRIFDIYLTIESRIMSKDWGPSQNKRSITDIFGTKPTRSENTCQ